jgi:hypothetical protein
VIGIGKWGAVVLALVLCLGAGAAVAGQAGPPAEFRGLAFGSPLEECPGLSPVEVPGPRAGQYHDVYFRPDEPLNMGEARLVSVAYYFNESRLHSVAVVIRGDADAFLVKDQLIAKYGPGRQVGGRYGWTWPGFSLVMERAPDRDLNVLTYTWEPAAENAPEIPSAGPIPLDP